MIVVYVGYFVTTLQVTVDGLPYPKLAGISNFVIFSFNSQIDPPTVGLAGWRLSPLGHAAH